MLRSRATRASASSMHSGWSSPLKSTCATKSVASSSVSGMLGEKTGIKVKLSERIAQKSAATSFVGTVYFCSRDETKKQRQQNKLLTLISFCVAGSFTFHMNGQKQESYPGFLRFRVFKIKNKCDQSIDQRQLTARECLTQIF